MKLLLTDMGKAEGGAGLGKIISRHMKVKMPIRHPVEKPVGRETQRSKRGEVQAGVAWGRL